MDKVLALRGGAEAVALWAQLSSVVEVVAGIALAGLGGGLAVLVAQAQEAERRRDLLRQALKIGLALSLAAGLAAVAAALLMDGGALRGWLVAAAAFAGWIVVIPGMLNNYWLGRERRDAQLALATVSALIAGVAAALAPPGRMLEWLLVAQAAPALALAAVWRPRGHAPRDAGHALALRRYVLPGIAIGVLSPASLLAARALVAASLSWHDAGVLQALWRVSDWIFGFASGVLSVLFLARIGSWIALFALYAMGRTRAIAAGELLSLPLFVLLLAAWGESLTLERAGAAWLLAYLAYAVFNYWAMRRP